MLIVKLNVMQFDYDIRAIVKSFYPEDEVRIVSECQEATDEIEISFLQDSILISFIKDKVKISEFEEKITQELFGTEYKNAFKKMLYLSLVKVTGVIQPWGNLTGIRPTKIPMTMLEQGKSEEEIISFLKDTHCVSDEKAELCLEIAKRELETLEGLNYENGYSLYIGIPFCPTTCLYCSFTSYPLGRFKNRVHEYLDALEKEIDYVAENFRDQELNTVYIGGGTPTTLEPEHLERLLKKVKSSFDFKNVREFTVEAGRADSITREKLEVLKKYEVSRISVNPQTMKNETLKKIGRHHSVEQVIEAYHLARELGFDNINMDIILGLPGEEIEDVVHTMEKIKELDPDNLTVHSLAVKRAAKLTGWIDENGMKDLKNSDEIMEVAVDGARQMGMEPYYLYRQKNMSGNLENVGFGKPGKNGIYNILIMEEMQTIVAVGAGTVTKRVFPGGRIERTDTVKDVDLYMSRIDEMIERKKVLFSLI